MTNLELYWGRGIPKLRNTSDSGIYWGEGVPIIRFSASGISTKTKTINSVSYIFKTGLSGTISSSSQVIKASSKTLDSDSHIAKPISKTINSDSQVFKIGIPKTLNSDSNVLDTLTDTIDLDSHILKEDTNTLDSDSFLSKPTSKTINSNLHIFKLDVSDTLTSNSHIVKYGAEGSLTSDSIITKLDISETIDSNTHITKTDSDTLDSDFHVIKTDTPKTLISDSQIIKSISDNIDSDFNVLKVATSTLNSDSWIVKPTLKTLSSDSHIFKSVLTYTLSSNSYIIKTDSNTIDDDSHILKEINKTLDSDSQLIKTGLSTTLSSSSYIGVVDTSVEYTDGKLNQSAVFDGIDSLVTLFNLSDMPLNFTICLWKKKTDGGGAYQQTFWGGNESGDGNYGFSLGSNSSDVDSTNIYFGVKSTNNVEGSVSYDPGDNEWHHIAVTKSGTTIKLYVDDDLKETNTDMDISEFRRSLNTSLSRSTQTFKGEIDDVRIYSDILTDSEIKVLVDGGRGLRVNSHLLKYYNKTLLSGSIIVLPIVALNSPMITNVGYAYIKKPTLRSSDKFMLKPTIKLNRNIYKPEVTSNTVDITKPIIRNHYSGLKKPIIIGKLKNKDYWVDSS